MSKEYTDEMKKWFAEHHAQPNKLLGQNFLIDQNILNTIIEAAEITPDDIILEVGPGIGNLTKELAKKAKKVVAVEKDKAMVEILEKNIKEFNNVEIIQGDILKIGDLKLEKYKIVANIPYYLTSHLIRIFLEEKKRPDMMLLMIQKEVAQRICAKAPDMNLLAASVQFYAEAKIVKYVSKNSFWPRPKIDSAIIKITPKKEAPEHPEAFFKIMKAGFSQPRKQLANNFAKSLGIKREEAEAWLAKNNIDPKQRAETLTIQDWVGLVKSQ